MSPTARCDYRANQRSGVAQLAGISEGKLGELVNFETSVAHTERERAASYIVRGQLCLAFFIAICVALHPGIVLKWNEGGMSNYGIHIKTAVPYSLALFLLAVCSQGAATFYSTEDPRARRLRQVLTAYGWIVLAMLLSTYVYSLNDMLRDLHFGIGTALIILEASASLWMYGLLGRFRWDGALLLVELLGSLLAILTIVGAMHVLFLAEVLVGAGFASLLIHTSKRFIVEEHLAAPILEVAEGSGETTIPSRREWRYARIRRSARRQETAGPWVEST